MGCCFLTCALSFCDFARRIPNNHVLWNLILIILREHIDFLFCWFFRWAENRKNGASDIKSNVREAWDLGKSSLLFLKCQSFAESYRWIRQASSACDNIVEVCGFVGALNSYRTSQLVEVMQEWLIWDWNLAWNRAMGIMTKRVKSISPVTNEEEFFFFEFRVEFNSVMRAEFSVHTQKVVCLVLHKAWNTETFPLNEVSIFSALEATCVVVASIGTEFWTF